MNFEWSLLDKAIARQHLSKYGFIIVDKESETPIDNEHDLRSIEKELGLQE